MRDVFFHARCKYTSHTFVWYHRLPSLAIYARSPAGYLATRDLPPRSPCQGYRVALRTLTLIILELQSHFGDRLVGSYSGLSPTRECSTKRVNLWYMYTWYTIKSVDFSQECHLLSALVFSTSGKGGGVFLYDRGISFGGGGRFGATTWRHHRGRLLLFRTPICRPRPPI